MVKTTLLFNTLPIWYGVVTSICQTKQKQQLCLNLLFDIYLSGFESFKTIFQSFMDLSDPTDSLNPTLQILQVKFHRILTLNQQSRGMEVQ